jgi:uncharacterized heparinase superfamily protein
MGPSVAQLIIVPPELRSVDPTFINEFGEGHLGLAGAVADFRGHNVFDVPPPSPAWRDRLNGFGWLRHLTAASDVGAELSRHLVLDWIDRNETPKGAAYLPAVTARRIVSWLSNGATLIEGSDAAFYDTFMRAIELQVHHLAGTREQAPVGHPRLACLAALVLAGLCVGDQEQLLRRHINPFLDELDAQVLPTGCHISRNSEILVDILFDLLPLTKCFVARDYETPRRLTEAIARIYPWLRYMQLGDGHLARFNGCGSGLSSNLATVLAYDDHMSRLPPAPQHGYVRLEAGDAVIICDVGRGPVLEHSSEAHAGALSFEISAGRHALLTNCGAPGPTDSDWRTHARSTAAHNTLSIDGASTGRLVNSRALDSSLEAPAFVGPPTVRAALRRMTDSVLLEASHDGYLERFGLTHTRNLRFASDGSWLTGFDKLGHPDPRGRIKGDVGFGVHFHVHPDVECRLSGKGVALVTRSGDRWLLTSGSGVLLSVEETVMLSDPAGPRYGTQIVLRGRCLDAAEVQWDLRRAPVPLG